MDSSQAAKIDKTLNEFSHKLIPSDEYISRGKKVVEEELLRELKKKSRFQIDRAYLSGSMGKKTAIFDSDLDCVVFVNNIDLHHIERVWDDFEDILTLAELPKLNVASMRKTRFSIQFRYDVFDVDLLPAINFVNYQQPPNPRLAALQAASVLRKITDNPKRAYHYSSALVESQLEFMKNQSGFIHELVRICKLWNKSLLIDGYISGRSTLIELIAVFTGQREEKRVKEDRSLLSAFQGFLRLIEDFPRLKIEFDDFDPMKPGGSLSQLNISPRDDPTLKGSFYVIEPANPFKNIAKGVKEGQMKKFQCYAKETLRSLSNYVNSVKVPLDDIFLPQPTVVPYVSDEEKKFFQTASFLVGARVEKGPLCPSMVIRNEEKYKARDMQGVLKHCQTVFSVVTQGFVTSVPYNSTKSADEIRAELQHRMYRCVDINVKGGEPREWVSATEKHEDYEVTFAIPCSAKVGDTEYNFCARISLKSN